MDAKMPQNTPAQVYLVLVTKLIKTVPPFVYPFT
jgi:hypothetical protein